MADVSVSYQKRDRALAERVVAALSERGYSVWWDDRITPAESWDRMIEREILQAKCVLVLWTPRSIGSEWVRIEANFAKSATPSKLVQLRLEPCELPIAFSLTQFADVFDGRFEAQSPGWAKIIDWVGLFAGAPVEGAAAAVETPTQTMLASATPAPPVSRATSALVPWWPLLSGAILALIIGLMRAYVFTDLRDSLALTPVAMSTAMIGLSVIQWGSLAAMIAVARWTELWRAVIFATAFLVLSYLCSHFIANRLIRVLLDNGHPTSVVGLASGALTAFATIIISIGLAAALGLVRRPARLWLSVILAVALLASPALNFFALESLPPWLGFPLWGMLSTLFALSLFAPRHMR